MGRLAQTLGLSMTRVTLRHVVSMPWRSHDSWSETFIGIHRLVYEILPQQGRPQDVRDAALCQLAIVGANHLLEVSLFKLIRPSIGVDLGNLNISEAKFKKAGYYTAISEWVGAITGNDIDLTSEPFLSTERLRERRNATAHKSSAIATTEMARSGLIAAVNGTRAIHSHFGSDFPYEKYLLENPLANEPLFSQIKFPGEA